MTDTGFVIYRARRRTVQAEGRYEYRVWPRSPHPAGSVLQRFWSQVGAERRTDVYLVHAASDRLLVKLRDGHRLEIKRRGDDVGTVQYWTMPFSTEFPLPADERTALSDALYLTRDLSADAAFSPAHLLAALDTRAAAVVPTRVRKSRLLFQSGKCRAEVCRVTVGSWTGLTIALEAPDLRSIARPIDELRLGALANRSYGEALVRLANPSSPHRRGLPAAMRDTERRAP